MSRKEIYLWGTLLALVREQLSALQKLTRGTLGIWGKSRINARNKAIQKFTFKLLQEKSKNNNDSFIEALFLDLEEIEKDQDIWMDITSEEINYMKTILRSIS